MSSTKKRSLCILGDILIYDPLSHENDKVKALLKDANIVLGNLETTFATNGFPAAKVFNLKADHSIVEEFIEMNMTAMSLANNHTMDFGFEGLFETIQVLNEHNIVHTGAGQCLSEAIRPAVLRLGDLKIAFLACSSHISGHSIAKEDRPGLVPLRVNVKVENLPRGHQESVGQIPKITTEADEEDLSTLLSIVENVRKEVDFIVASVHWNSPVQMTLFDYQIDVAHRLIDGGVDLIMGHGPHLLQGVEAYGGGYIFYSLGHFVFHPHQPAMAKKLAMLPKTNSLKRAIENPIKWRLNETAIGRVVFEGSKVCGVEVIPIMLRNGSPQLCDKESAMSILNYMIVVSKHLGTHIYIEGNRGIVEA
jgi:poly-gamma-glutamate synthesis protein (capsule biosynthesis protein)